MRRPTYYEDPATGQFEEFSPTLSDWEVWQKADAWGLDVLIDGKLHQTDELGAYWETCSLTWIA